jgi:transcriptional regulator with XRE-family HTH domain
VQKLREIHCARLRAARAAKGWSRDTLAYEVRRRIPNNEYLTSARSIQRWESGKNQPAAAIVPVLGEALGVSVSYLYGEDEDGSEDDEEAALHAALDNLADALMLVMRQRAKRAKA